jgi:cell division protein FtsB
MTAEFGDRRVLAVISTYDDLIAALRARSDELKLTRLGLDRAMKTLPDGYASKLLGEIPIRTLGRVSLGPVLGALVLLAVEDLTALKKIEHQLERRIRPLRNAGDGMPAEDARKKRRRNPLRGCSEWGRLMRNRQIANQSPAARSQSARRAARIRWRQKKSVCVVSEGSDSHKGHNSGVPKCQTPTTGPSASD